MLKVKIFDESHEMDLEKIINNYLIINPHIRIIDIKYQVIISIHKDDQIYIYSAMIFYSEVKECIFCAEKETEGSYLRPVNSESSIHINKTIHRDRTEHFLNISNVVEENSDYSSVWAKKIYYCPICGRKLEEHNDKN